MNEKLIITIDGPSGVIKSKVAKILAEKLGYQYLDTREMINIQRKIGEERGIVVEESDTGTEVFTYADVKFYLDVSIEIRGKKRFYDIKSREDDVELNRIIKDIGQRDTDGTMRDISSLRKTTNAIYIDTNKLNIDEVVIIMLQHIYNKLIEKQLIERDKI